MKKYSKFNNYIKNNFPDFVDSKYYDEKEFLDGSSTLFIGFFGNYLDDIIINRCPKLSDLEKNTDLKKTIKLINDNIDNSDEEIVNTINLELIERFENTKNSVIYAKKYLNEKARKILESSIKWDGNK
jgi:hypothetical protein